VEKKTTNFGFRVRGGVQGGKNTDTNPVWTGIKYGHTPRRGCGGRGGAGPQKTFSSNFPKIYRI